MSHARPTLSPPVGWLANAMSLSAGFGPLITTAGRALLPAPSCRAASITAVPLTAVTAAAHKEQDATARAVTEPWAQRRLRHHRLDFGAHFITIPWIADDRRMIAPSALMMSPVPPMPAKDAENYVFR